MAPASSQRKKKEIDAIASSCFAGRIRLLNRVITRIYDDAFRPFGVKTSQLNIMVVAALREPARPADVCEALELDASTLSRNLERLRARGWIETLADAEDGRAQPFRLTSKGRRVLEQVTPAWREAQRKAEDLLGTEGVELLYRVTGDMGFGPGNQD